jgi:hypothetical protein
MSALRMADSLPDRVEVLCDDWTREDLIQVLSTLKSVRTGQVEISLRENRVVGVRRKPFVLSR